MGHLVCGLSYLHLTNGKNAAENKWHSDLFTNGEKPNGKNPLNDFQVTTPESPLLSQQVVTSKEF